MKLSSEQQAWLNAHIENGEFASVDDAMGWLINERMAQESDDMAWARPMSMRPEARHLEAPSYARFRGRDHFLLSPVYGV